MLTNDTGIHLCTLKPDAWNKIVDGLKTIESRMTIPRQPPFENVKTGDVVYCKHQNMIYGMFIVGAVSTYYDLSTDAIERLISTYRDRVCAPREWWILKSNAKYFTFIEVAGWYKLKPIKLKNKNLSQSCWKLNFDIDGYDFEFVEHGGDF